MLILLRDYHRLAIGQAYAGSSDRSTVASATEIADYAITLKRWANSLSIGRVFGIAAFLDDCASRL